MRCPLVIVTLDDGTRPFAVCADMAEAVVQVLNAPLPDDQQGWEVRTKPFDHHQLEMRMEEILFPHIFDKSEEDPKLVALMDVIGKTPAPPHPISEAYL